MKTKFVVVTGGVISGLGKGITASSIGLLFQNAGYTVTAIKIDPYLNIDAGTMSPYEHGECYVLSDGGETDLDLGNYERFLNIELTKDSNITSGKVYQSVLNKERNGYYLGKTVQIVPHITDEIQEMILSNVNSNNADICIIELGGVIGDIETMAFTKALSELSLKFNNFCFVHVSLIIDNGEPKTKPTQHSVSQLRSLCINPDLLVLRCRDILDEQVLNKISRHTHINKDNIICNTDVKNIYYVPSIFYKQKILSKICNVLNLPLNHINMEGYNNILSYFDKTPSTTFTIGIAGKYTGLQDTYLSLIRAIEHASFKLNKYTQIKWINTEKFDDTDILSCDGVIIPGGFGIRGISGKLQVAKLCRENKIPLLGLCLGMQVMTCEFAINVCNINGSSEEWDQNTSNKIFHMLPDQTEVYGGTMRLGDYTTATTKDTLLYKCYKKTEFNERHRHRYEFNNIFRDILSKKRLIFSGLCPENGLVEVIELSEDIHPFYLGAQYHPEYKTRYNEPHPLFVGFISKIN